MKFLLVLLILITAPLFAANGMWQGFPEGWVYAPVMAYDSWPGIYHDEKSGACISFDVAWPFVVKPFDKGIEGTQMSVKYKLKIAESGSCSGGIILYASFFPETEDLKELVWNVSAPACDDAQKLRVTDFLFGKKSGPVTSLPKIEDFRRLKRSEILAVRIGSTYKEIVSQIGEPSDAECGPDLGFTACYYETDGNEWISHKFIFDKQHRLKTKSRTKN